jgi:nifR3 family TIM-barrel protein
MAGLTHSALRTLLLDCGGVGLLSTEMLAAKRLPVENERISPFLVRTAVESPLSYQLLVVDKAEVKPAVKRLHQLSADAIDLNLGCPAPRVRRKGGGSSLMAQPDRVRGIVATARQATELPLTAKIRLGESFDEQKLCDFCQMLEGEGIDMLTVHARLRKEAFCRTPHWEWVGKVKSWISIPVIANGGIMTVADAQKCFRISGADGLMIGRAAAHTPWLFADIAKEIYGIETREKQRNFPAMYAVFVQALLERFLAERRLGRLKEFTHYFAANYLFGHTLAVQVQTASSVDQAWKRAMDFYRHTDPDGVEQAVMEISKVNRALASQERE